MNEALDFFKIIAPDISKAYDEFSRSGQSYADVLDLIKQKQEAVNESNKYTIYTQNKKEILDRRIESNRLKKRLDNYFSKVFPNGQLKRIPIDRSYKKWYVNRAYRPKF